MKIDSLEEFYTSEQIESLLGKCPKIKADYFLEKSFLDVGSICNINIDKIDEEYGEKIKDAGFFKKRYLAYLKNIAKQTYSGAIKNINYSLDVGGLEKEITLNLLNAFKKKFPEKIPQEILEKMN